MKIFITGICGFVGSTLAKTIRTAHPDWDLIGIDNFSRAGSWHNKQPILDLGIQLIVGDIRNASDLEVIPDCDWVIDAAANPSVLAGIDGKTSSRQLVEHNLQGTINLLEYCKRHQAGFILLSTSRVYSIAPLAQLKLKVEVEEGKNRFTPDRDSPTSDLQPPSSAAPSTSTDNLNSSLIPAGLTPAGINEEFPTTPPVSLYGSTKVASEHLALEYGATFDFPVWINRCGVMAGAGQFGHPAQGIFAFWIHSFREGRPLKYIGFDGLGHQVRDCLHPCDLLPILEKQIATPDLNSQLKLKMPRIFNLSGGVANTMSLAELTTWCSQRFPDSATSSSLPTGLSSPISPPEKRPFDLPWVVLDPSLASETWDWQSKTSIETVCEEIAIFAENHPDWIKFSRV